MTRQLFIKEGLEQARLERHKNLQTATQGEKQPANSSQKVCIHLMKIVINSSFLFNFLSPIVNSAFIEMYHEQI